MTSMRPLRRAAYRLPQPRRRTGAGLRWAGEATAPVASRTSTRSNTGAACAETFLCRQDGAPLELIYAALDGSGLVTATQRHSYMLDRQGSVQALTDDGGALQDQYSYDPYVTPPTRRRR